MATTCTMCCTHNYNIPTDRYGNVCSTESTNGLASGRGLLLHTEDEYSSVPSEYTAIV